MSLRESDAFLPTGVTPVTYSCFKKISPLYFDFLLLSIKYYFEYSGRTSKREERRRKTVETNQRENQQGKKGGGGGKKEEKRDGLGLLSESDSDKVINHPEEEGYKNI